MDTLSPTEEPHLPQTDAQLLAVVRGGDRGAFHELYRRHASVLIRYAWRLADDSADAEDLVQEVFATAWTKRRTITIVGDSLLPWLLVTCRNHGANLVRKKARTRTVPIDTDAADLAQPTNVEDFDELRWVRTELAELSPLDQQICQLCFVGGIPYKTAAVQLGISANGVAKRVERIRKQLRAARATD
jgi:RNA polymerase sigma-70 factor (ECF subfamily)